VVVRSVECEAVVVRIVDCEGVVVEGVDVWAEDVGSAAVELGRVMGV